ncbi:MAG: sensor histidine kinase [Thiogranum sp.]
MSLKYRIALVIFILEAVMMTAVLWKTLGHAIDSSNHQIKATEQAALDIVSNIARVALLDEDFDRVQGYIEKLPRNPNILKALLVDERDIVVASSTFADLGETLPPLRDSDTDHWSTLELSNPAGNLGLLAVQFSDQACLASYRGALNQGITIAAIGMGLIAVFGIGFGYLLTLRLQRLAHATEQISRGNYSVRTGLHGRDEIARVGAAFDKMTRIIAAERQALADANRELDNRVKARTRDLEQANLEHKAFAYAISHDLRAPLRTLSGFSQALFEDYAEQLDDTARDYLSRIQNGAQSMGELIEGLLKLSRVSQVEINHEPLDLSAMCNELLDELRQQEPERKVVTDIQPGVRAEGDRHLLRDALGNLIGNAWKFTAKEPRARIRFGTRQTNGTTVFYVEDNGAGFDPGYADKLFTPFQRLHHARDFPGAGIGLSTVRRIIQRHAGCLWASSRAGSGATFYFTLQRPRPDGIAEDGAVAADLNSAVAGPM